MRVPRQERSISYPEILEERYTEKVDNINNVVGILYIAIRELNM